MKASNIGKAKLKSFSKLSGLYAFDSMTRIH